MDHQQFLKRFQVGDLVQAQQEVISANQHTTVQEAIGLLHRHKIQSLPILDTEGKECLGVVNMFDLVSAIAFQDLFKNYADEQLNQLPLETFERAQRLAVFDAPVTSVLGVSEESKTTWIYDSSSDLRDLLSVFCRGVHRVLVRFPAPVAHQPSSSVYRVLSQTDVVRFLHTNQNVAELQAVMQRTVHELGLLDHRTSSAVVALNHHSTALSAFQKMSLTDVSALPVVDDENRLLTTISVSDLRMTTQETFRWALLPVLDFLKLVRGVPQQVVTCQANSTLHQVVTALLQSKVHRVWVVNEAHAPVGVVTLTDVIALFSPYR